MIKLSRYKNGNPKRASQFICCKHCGENYIGTGIQRGGHQREKLHCKDLFCICCQTVTKNLEVRWCDDYLEVFEKAQEMREKYYPKENNRIGK